MKEIIEHTCRMYECTAEFVEDQYFPVTVNTRECVDLARKAVRENCGTEALDPNCPMWMATETFSITESIYPGVFFLQAFMMKRQEAAADIIPLRLISVKRIGDRSGGGVIICSCRTEREAEM